MTGREKIQAALSERGSPSIPVVICYESIFVRDHWSALTHCPWWYRFSADLDQQLRWRRDVVGATGQDWLVLPPGFTRDDRRCLRIEADGDSAVLIDSRTESRQTLLEPTIGGWSAGGAVESRHVAGLPSSREQVAEQMGPPEIDDLEAYRESGIPELSELLVQEFPAVYPIVHIGSPLWRTYSLWGYEGMMTLVATRPDLVEFACEALLREALWALRTAKVRGAAGIWIEECLTDQISPQAFARLNTPFVKTLVDEIRRLGMQSVYYFCGNPEGKWDEILSVGADALSLEESKKGFTIDMENVVHRAAGSCAVLGNLDAINLLEHGTETDLRREIARQIAAGRRHPGSSGVRFVQSIGSPVTPGTTVERVRRYCEITRELAEEVQEADR